MDYPRRGSQPRLTVASRRNGWDAGSLRHAIDADGAVSERYGVQFIPTTYLIDREERMVGRTVAPKAWDSDTATELLMSLINQPQG